jgi:hypothetical protein
VAARSKAWVFGRSLAGIAGSNHAVGMNVSFFWVLCVVRYSSLRRADHSSGGVLQSVVCLSVISKTSRKMRPRPTRAVEPWKIKINPHECGLIKGWLKFFANLGQIRLPSPKLYLLWINTSIQSNNNLNVRLVKGYIDSRLHYYCSWSFSHILPP